MIVPGVVLSAGQSSRMGRPKALLPAGGDETFLSRIVRTLHRAGVVDVVVVAATNGPLPEIRSALALACRQAAEGPGAAAVSHAAPTARLILNPDASRGQLSSLLCGLEAIDRPDVSAMMLTLVDIPLVDPETVRALLDTYARTRAPVVRPIRAEPSTVQTSRTHGHPVILDRALFDPLRAADPAQGAKPVIRAYADRAVTVPVTDNAPFIDIDTPEAYESTFGSVLE